MSRVCDYQTNGCKGDTAVVFVEYEADTDLCYSLEHNGAVYGWWGHMCNHCRREAYLWIGANPPWRWREIPMAHVRYEPIPDSKGWENVTPNWDCCTAEGFTHSMGDWDKPMPISPQFLVYVKDHPDEWALCDTCREWYWRKEEHNCRKEVET